MSISDRFDELTRWLLIALFGLLPFFLIPTPLIGVTQGKVALVAIISSIAVILWGVARYYDTRLSIPSVRLLGVAMALPLVYALSAAVNGFTNISLFADATAPDTLAIVCFEFVLLVLTACTFVGRTEKIATAVRFLFAGGLVAVALQTVHMLIPMINLGPMFAAQTANAFGTWHEFAMFCGMLTVLGLALIDTPVFRGHWRYVLYAAIALSALILALGAFLDVWLTVFVAVVALMAVRGYRENALYRESFWRSQWLLIIVALVALFFAAFGSYLSRALPEGIAVAYVEVRPSWQGTLDVSRQSLADPTRVFFGTGPNTFTREWGLHKPLDINETQFWNASFPVGVASVPTSLITTGIFGVMVWIIFIGSAVFFIVRAWLARSVSALETIPLSIAALYLIVFQLFSIPGLSLMLCAFMIVGLLIASASTSIYTVSLRAIEWKNIVAGIGIVALVLTTLYISVTMMRVLVSELSINRAIAHYNTTLDAPGASERLSTALRIYPTDRAHRAAVQLGLLQLQQLNASANSADETAKEQLRITLESTIQHGLDAVSLNSRDSQNWLELASLYAQLANADVEGAYDSARAAFERAFEENPTSPIALLNLAQLEILQEKPDAALAYLTQAIQLKKNYAAAYYLASQIYAGKADYENAIAAATEAVRYATDDHEAWYNLGAIAYTAKQYETAVQALEQALVREARFPNAMYVLGLSYAELDRVSAAITQFEALEKLEPSEKSVKTILENLRAGRAPLSGISSPVPSTSQKKPASTPR